MNYLIELGRKTFHEFGRKKQIKKYLKMARKKGVDEDGIRYVPDQPFPKKKGWKAKSIKKYRKLTNSINYDYMSAPRHHVIEFNAEKGYSTATKFSKSKGDENKTIGGATLGAGVGAAGGAGVLKARQKVLNRQVGERRIEVRRKTKLRKGAQKTLIDGKWVPNPSSKYIERARMRAKHGKDWWKKDKSSVFAGKNRKVLGYGALAGAALGGIAGHLSRGKKED